MKKWPADKLEALREAREAGHNWAECGRIVGVSEDAARIKGLQLGLPRRMSFGPYSGVRVVTDKLEQKHRDPNQTHHLEGCVRVAPLLAPLQVGEFVYIKADTSKQVKKVHSHVSRYGMNHNKGFRGKLDWRLRIIKVERVR